MTLNEEILEFDLKRLGINQHIKGIRTRDPKTMVTLNTIVTSEAAPIELDHSDIAWLERHHPRSAIDEMIKIGRFRIFDEQKDGQVRRDRKAIPKTRAAEPLNRRSVKSYCGRIVIFDEKKK